MNRSKDKGTAFESQVAEDLRETLGPTIERRALSGANDRGDISGVYFMGHEVVIECKNHRRMELAEWCDEAEREAENAEAPYWFVIHKRKGCGEKSFDKTYVTTSFGIFKRVLTHAFGKRG